MITELSRRWAEELTARPWWVALALVLGFSVLSRVWEKRDVRGWVAIALTLGGIAWAWSLLWASDDAFITFRYAEHLANGDGLVFNVGERVEGYTDFLWALIIAACLLIGAPAPESALLISLASDVVALLLIIRLARALPGAPVFPLALALTAANYTVASFATGGLETVFAMMLVLLALVLAHADRPFLAGLAGVLAALSHPDHVLFYGALGVALLWTSRSLRAAVRYAAPFFLLFLPWFLWRWRYYGDLFPNTYYAKSGGEAWFSQGGAYLLVTAIGCGLPLLAPLVGIGAWATRSTLLGRFALIALPVYLTYVAKIGGDFMLGRLVTSALPLLFLLAEAGVRQLLLQGNRPLALSLTVLGALALTPARIVRPGEVFEGIADERTFTPVTRFSPLEVDAGGFRLGRGLHETFTAKGLTPKVAVFSLGMASFGSKLPTFDLRGLTSRSVAHLPLLERGRPGHEKTASAGLVLAADVELSMIPLAPPPYDALTRTEISGVPFWLRHARPEWGGPNVAAWIDSQPFTEERARIECTAWHLRESYFSVVDDAERRQRLLAKLPPELAADVALMLQPPRGASRVLFDFEDLATWTGSKEWAVTEAPPRQLTPYGHQGAFVDTFTAKGDETTGALTSPPFELRGDALTVRVGGGFSPQTRVELVVDDVVVRTARGCDTEWLGTRAWDLSALRGKTATLRIVDESSGGWGHLLVDEFTEWTDSPPRRE